MSLKETIQVFKERTSEGLHATYYNYISRKTAYTALDTIEKEKGKLSASSKKMADTYAVDILGGREYAPWLYVYTVCCGEFKEGWIPDNFYHLRLIPRIQGDYGRLSFLKPMNQVIFGNSISPDIAFFVNGNWFDGNFSKLTTDTLKEYIFESSERVIYKMDQSLQGKGIRICDINTFDILELEALGNGTVQKFIEQHQFFRDFHSGSVATIRVTTVINLIGKVDVRAAYLRLGCSADTFVKSDSHVRIPIDLKTGELYAQGYLPNWSQTTHHPDAQIIFANKCIPAYQEVINTAVSLHRKFPMVMAIGWDFTVDNNNQPQLMEWNGYGNDIKFSEATQGPCFSDLGWNESRVK
ncbi:hypothetical protein LCGC14_0945110 [marine sediment metagenome]|uniref:Alpha-L-glutamate ligase-related protein ATP-grasp domain-containing protein n=1 Tax=marine sediment metagenome TaxID=412755 RepID=A0A0F9P514_9ZZZZ